MIKEKKLNDLVSETINEALNEKGFGWWLTDKIASDKNTERLNKFSNSLDNITYGKPGSSRRMWNLINASDEDGIMCYEDLVEQIMKDYSLDQTKAESTVNAINAAIKVAMSLKSVNPSSRFKKVNGISNIDDFLEENEPMIYNEYFISNQNGNASYNYINGRPVTNLETLLSTSGIDIVGFSWAIEYITYLDMDFDELKEAIATSRFDLDF